MNSPQILLNIVLFAMIFAVALDLRPEDFARFAGFEAKLELASSVEGQRRWRGTLLGLQNDQVVLRLDGGEEMAFPLARLAKAKLVLSDELIAASEAGKL